MCRNCISSAILLDRGTSSRVRPTARGVNACFLHSSAIIYDRSRGDVAGFSLCALPREPSHAANSAATTAREDCRAATTHILFSLHHDEIIIQVIILRDGPDV